MLNIKNYPYPLLKLYKNIKSKKDYFSKFFCLIDLFESSINYLHFIVTSQDSFLEKKLPNFIKNDDILLKIKELKSLSKVINKNDNFIIDLEIIKKLEKLYNYIQKVNLNTHLEEKEYKTIFLKSSISLFTLLDSIDLFNKYQIFIPYQIKKAKKEISYISFNGNKPKFIKEIFEERSFFINKIYLKPKNNLNSSIAINTDIFYDYLENKDYGFNKKFQEELNAFIFYITKSKYFQLSLFFEDNDDYEYNQKDKIIERALEFENIEKFLTSNEFGYFFIVGPYGIGKTTLINNYQKLITQKEVSINLDSLTYEQNNWINKYINSDKTFYNILISDKNKDSFSFDTIVNQINSSDNKNFELNNEISFHKLLTHISKKEKKQIIIIENIHLLDRFNSIYKFIPDVLPSNIYFIFTMSSREIYPIPELKNKVINYLPHFSKAELMKFYQNINLNIPKINENILSDIIKNSYSIPLYAKYFILKNFKTDISQANKIKSFLLKNFKLFILEINKIILEFNPKFIDYHFYFFSLLSISAEGFNKKEIKEILIYLPEEIIDVIIDKSGDFILKINGRYKLINAIYEDFCLSNISEEKIIFLHNKIIDFFEPWEKKISSITLKNLPNHYFLAKRIDELKLLLQTNFIKSKFKLYPSETLKDLEKIIFELSKDDVNTFDIIKFLFIYQNLREESKKELNQISELSATKNTKFLLDKFVYINKPEEKFLQLLITSLVFSEKKYTNENKFIIKEIIDTPENFINKKYSELIFRISAEILMNEGIDIINLPKTKEEGVTLIKYIKENYNSQKLIDVFIKLTEIILYENDRAFILEALINKVSSFKNTSTVELFFSKVITSIEKFNNTNLKDRLYYIYIYNFTKNPFLYNKFFDKLVNKRNDIKNESYKFMFYINLSKVFININQDNIAFSYLKSAIDSIIETIDDNNPNSLKNNKLLICIRYLYKNISSFEKISFYQELIDKLLLMSNKIITQEKIDIKISFLEFVKDDKKLIELIKEIFALIITFDVKEINTIKRLFPYVSKIKDKRIKNPIIKKISTYCENIIPEYIKIIELYFFVNSIEISSNESITHKINYLLLDKSIKSEKLIITSNTNNFLLKEFLYLVISSKNVSFEFKRDFITNNIELIEDDKLKEELFKFFIENIYTLDEYSLSMNLENILKLSYFIGSTFEQISALSSFINFLINKKRFELAYQTLNKIFLSIIKENDTIISKIILIFINKSKDILDINNREVYFRELLDNIQSIILNMKNEELILDIISNIFSELSNVNNISNINEILNKILSLLNKIVNPEIKNKIIHLIRKIAPLFKDNSLLIDIIQKTIVNSEENFALTCVKSKSLISIALLNEKYQISDISESIIKVVLLEVRTSSYEIHILDVIEFLSNQINKYYNNDKSLEIYKLLVNSNKNIKSQLILCSLYIIILSNLLKNEFILDKKDIIISLFNKSDIFNEENTKTNYLYNFIIFITDSGYFYDNKYFIDSVFETIDNLNIEENKVYLYKAIFHLINKNNYFQDKKLVLKLFEEINNISNIYHKTELKSLLSLLVNKIKISNMLIEAKELDTKIDNIINNVSDESESKQIILDSAINDTALIFDCLELLKNMDDKEKKMDFIISFYIKLIATKKEFISNKLSQELIDCFNSIKDEDKKIYYLKNLIDRINKVKIEYDFKEISNIFFNIDYFKKDYFKCKFYIIISEFYKYQNIQESKNLYLDKFNAKIKEIPEENIKLDLLCTIIFEKIDYDDEEYINKHLPDLIRRIKVEKFSEELLIMILNKIFDKDLNIELKLKNEIKLFIKDLDISSYLNNELAEYICFICAYTQEIDTIIEVLDGTNIYLSREKILSSIIRLLFRIKDRKSLLKLSSQVLKTGRLVDNFISFLLLTLENKKEIDIITQFMIPKKNNELF